MVGAMEKPSPRAPVLLTADPTLRDAVLAAAAAAGTTPTAVTEADEVLGVHTLDQPLVIGIDRVEQLSRRTLPPAAVICLVGAERDRADLCTWSAPLGARVVVLPDGVRWLTNLLAGRSGAQQGRVVGIVGGHGGAGASTLAVSLAQVARRSGTSAAVVDLDQRGGGLDLLLGVERESGWRWPDLAASAGYIDDLATHLPRGAGVPVLAMARGRQGPGAPSAEAVAAVLRSLGRTHELVLVDLGRSLDPGVRQALRHCHVPIVVTGSGVRQVAGAQQVLADLAHERAGVAVRPVPGGAGALAVADALEVGLVGELPHEPRLVPASERAEQLGEVTRRWRRACRDLLEAVDR